MGADPSRLISRTHNLNPQAIVVEIAKAVGLALKDLHFGVEALGDAVVAGEAPHRGDLGRQEVKGLAELHQLRQAGLAQLVNGLEEARDQHSHCLRVRCFFSSR